MSRLRVLRVIGRLNMGGPAHQAALLSGRRFDPERYDTLLVHGNVAPGEESLAEVAEEEGARSLFLPELRQPVSPAQDARALAKLGRIARGFRPHIVHTHLAKGGFVGRGAALTVRPRPAIVHTYHGHVLEGYFGAGKTAVYRGLERTLGRVSDRLIGVSQATVDDLIRLGIAPAEKFEVVPLGLDLAPLAEVDEEERHRRRADLGLADDAVLALFVGRVVPIKRLSLLLDALAMASGSERRLHLAVVGDGESRPGLERQVADLRLADSVHFLGYQRELRPLLAAADIAVLSSDNEGTPVSLIEAAAAGVPSVATDVGGVSEVVNGADSPTAEGYPDSGATDAETGILVPPGDAGAFAAALTRLARDPGLRARMGAAAQQRALHRYGVDRLISDIDRLYRELTKVSR